MHLGFTKTRSPKHAKKQSLDGKLILFQGFSKIKIFHSFQISSTSCQAKYRTPIHRINGFVVFTFMSPRFGYGVKMEPKTRSRKDVKKLSLDGKVILFQGISNFNIFLSFQIPSTSCQAKYRTRIHRIHGFVVFTFMSPRFGYALQAEQKHVHAKTLRSKA